MQRLKVKYETPNRLSTEFIHLFGSRPIIFHSFLYFT